MTSRTRKRYRFGPFELDAHDRLLTTQGDVVPLTPKALDTLLILVELGGHVVTKDELIERVWPDSFVEQNNLAQNISALRKALGEGAEGLRYIDTVPKRGYRFIAPVTAYEVTIDQDVAERDSTSRRRGGRLWDEPRRAARVTPPVQDTPDTRSREITPRRTRCTAIHTARTECTLRTARTASTARRSAARVCNRAGGHGLSLHEQALHGGSALAPGGHRRDRPRGSRAPRRNSTSPKRAMRAAAT